MSVIDLRRQDYAAYGSWESMRVRCRYPEHDNYKYYGGKGISIDPRWDNFWNFLEDMGERPEGFSLDRIDGSKDYTKSNCRWLTPKGQARSRTSSRMLSYKGESRCVSEWAEMLGINCHVLFARLRRGWDDERTISTPHQQRRAHKA